MALAAGFGIDLATCDPEVLAALYELLEDRESQERSERMKSDLAARLGR